MTTADDAPFDGDVLIVGAGPVGLSLAGELALRGCTAIVLEQASGPPSPLKSAPFGLRGLTVPTVEALDRRGMLDAVLKRQQIEPSAADERQRRPGGHFAGIDFFCDEPAPAFAGAAPRRAKSAAADMATIEAVLAERAQSLGVALRRGIKVDGVRQTGSGVVVDAGGARLRARYLVGCDGGRSIVRKTAGFGFAGTDPEFTGYSLRLTLEDVAVLPAGRTLALGGVVIYAPPDTLWMAEYDGGAAHRALPLDREHVEAVLRRVSGTKATVTALHLATTWTDRACLASTYRIGRVLLAGDAAHIHSPLGGQGLNLGLGDAMNLGWKLAAVVRGDAPPDLLDSYERERRPIAATILDRSRAQVALLRPDPGSRALEAIMADLIATQDGGRYFAERISGAGLCHDLGDAHPMVGRSMADVALADGSRLNERLRDGSGLVVDFSGHPPPPLPPGVAYAPAERGIVADVAAALVRPDGVVAWVGAPGSGFDGLDAALRRWFGRGDLPAAARESV